MMKGVVFRPPNYCNIIAAIIPPARAFSYLRTFLHLASESNGFEEGIYAKT